jgi:sodium transport system permease protein
MRSFTGLILKKELLEIFRDRRSVIMALALPLIIYPLMFWFIGSQASAELGGPSETRIAADTRAYAELSAIFEDPVFEASDLIIFISKDPLHELAAGGADIAAYFPQASDLSLIYDPNRTTSFFASGHLTHLLMEYNQAEQAREVFERWGEDLAELAPVSFAAEALVTEEGMGSAGLFLSMVLPMILVILLSVGGMPTAVDLFAGEKERRTFEPLLCTAARRTDILAGKLGAVTIMALLSALACGLGLFIGYMLSPSAMTLGMDDAQGLNLPPLTLLLTILIIMAMAVFFSGLHVLLSTYARTIKEASTYGSFVMIVAYVPVFASMNRLGGDFERWTAFVPVMNITGCLKMVLAGKSDMAYMGITLAVTAAFVFAVLAAGRYMFKKENIMLRA